MGVIAFQKRENDKPHLSGEAICAACNHAWVAVAPIGSTLLECPACHTEKGRMKYSCMPAAGSLWHCNCGCDIFRVTSKAALCINCGNSQAF